MSESFTEIVGVGPTGQEPYPVFLLVKTEKCVVSYIPAPRFTNAIGECESMRKKYIVWMESARWLAALGLVAGIFNLALLVGRLTGIITP